MAISQNTVRMYPFPSEAPRLDKCEFQCQSSMRQAYSLLNFSSEKFSTWQQVIWSLVCHSAVWDDKVLCQILKLLQNKDWCPIYIAGHCFTSVQLEKGTTNRTLADGEKIREVVLPIHPITLAMIKKLPDNLRLPSSLLKEAIRELPFEPYQPPGSLRQFCRGAIGVSEILAHQALPEHAIQAWNTKLPTSTLSLTQFECLHYEIKAPDTQDADIMPMFEPAKSQRLSIKPERSIYRKLKVVFRKVGKKDKPEPTVLLGNLKALLTDCYCDNERILLCWLIHKIEVDKTRVSSALRYHAAISRRWLATFEGESLVDFTTEQIDDAYEGILNTTTSDNSVAYVKGRLRDLHEFAFQCFDIAPTTIDWGSKQNHHVRAAIVSESLFQWLLQQIDTTIGWSSHDKLTVKVALIFLYRTGLRSGELKKLFVGEVEFSEHCWLYVFNNECGTNKSISAKRKIPLRALVTETEWPLCQQYLSWVKLNEQGEKSMLFHAENDDQSTINIHMLSMWVSQKLTQKTGDTTYCLHSLRHSFVNRMYLIFNGIAHWPGVVEYQDHELDKIHETLLSGDPNNHMLLLAALAGHESPLVTYRSYIHLTPILIAQFIKSIDIRLTVKQMKNIRLSQAQGYQYTGFGNTMGYSEGVNKVVKTYGIEKQNPVVSVPVPITVPKLSRLQASQIKIVCHVLTDIVAGVDMATTAIRYMVDIETIKPWLKRHKAFFSSTADMKTRQPFKLPKGKKETAQLSTLLRNISRLTSDERTKIEKITPYLLQHFPKSRSGLYFASPRQLNQCLTAFSALTKPSDWKVELVSHYTNRVKKRWKNSLKGIEVYRETHNARQAKGTVFLYYAPKQKLEEESTQTKSTRTLWTAIYLHYVLSEGERGRLRACS